MAAIETWDAYGAATDRGWLEPSVDVMYDTGTQPHVRAAFYREPRCQDSSGHGSSGAPAVRRMPLPPQQKRGLPGIVIATGGEPMRSASRDRALLSRAEDCARGGLRAGRSRRMAGR